MAGQIGFWNVEDRLSQLSRCHSACNFDPLGGVIGIQN